MIGMCRICHIADYFMIIGIDQKLQEIEVDIYNYRIYNDY